MMRTTRALATAGISFARVYPQPQADSDGPAPSHSRLQRDVPLPFRNSTSLDVKISDRRTSESEIIVPSTVDSSIGAITTRFFVGHTEERQSITVVSTALPEHFATSPGVNLARTTLSTDFPGTLTQETTGEGPETTAQPTTNYGFGAASSEPKQWSELTTPSTEFLPGVGHTSGLPWHTSSLSRQPSGVSTLIAVSPSSTTSAKQLTKPASISDMAPQSTKESKSLKVTLITHETPAASSLAATVLETTVPASSHLEVHHSSSYSIPAFVSSTIIPPQTTNELTTSQSTGSQRTAEATLSGLESHSEQQPLSLSPTSTATLKHFPAELITSMARQSTRLPVGGDISYNSAKDNTSQPAVYSLGKSADVLWSGSETTSYSKQDTTLVTYIKTDSFSRVTRTSAGVFPPTSSIPDTPPTITNDDSARPEQDKTMTTVGITTGAVSAGIMCGIVLFFIVGWYRRKTRHGGTFVASPMLSSRGLMEVASQQPVQQGRNSHFAFSWNQNQKSSDVRNLRISKPVKIHSSLDV